MTHKTLEERLVHDPDSVSDEALMAHAMHEVVSHVGSDKAEADTVISLLVQRLERATTAEGAPNTEFVNDLPHPLGCHAIEDPLLDRRLVCALHGALWVDGECLTWTTLREVAEHRRFQYENYGPNRDLEDGTGPGVEWLAPVVESAQSSFAGPWDARTIEGLFREEWDFDVDPEARYTWMLMLREEVAEAFRMEAGSKFLPSELVQVSALAVSWMEKIHERGVLARAAGVCPVCGSHTPALHPAVQHGGEVQPCLHPFHETGAAA